mgnify:CR=1 FL=1
MRPPPNLESGPNAGIRANPVQQNKGFGIAIAPVQGLREAQRSAHSPNLGVDAPT